MKNIINKIILVNLFVWISMIGYCQVFNLDDSTFQIGDVYNPVNKISYPLNGINVDSNGIKMIDSVIFFMKKNMTISIEIGVHVMTKSMNVKLMSQRLDVGRAEAIMEYMVVNGIGENRLKAKGYWMESPLISKDEINKIEDSKEKMDMYMKNRRTEFKITLI